MRILNISNINFRAIKVTNDKYINNSPSVSYDSEIAYRNLNDTFEYAKNIAEGIEVLTKSDQNDLINKNYYQKRDEEQRRIYKGHKSETPAPIRAIKMWNADRKLKNERDEAKKATRPSELMDAKKASVEQLEQTFNDGIKRVEELDKNLQNATVASSALSKNSSNIAQKNNCDGFCRIAGYEEEKAVLDDVFVSKVQLEKEGAKVEVPGSVLFFGPYNNGKTYITKNVASEAGCKIVKIKAGNSKKFMEKLYEQALASKERFNQTQERTIIFIDELDRLVNANSDNSKEFEEFIKTCSDEYHCSVFGATNSPNALGLNLDDPDIFPVRMSIDVANDENLKAVLKYYLEDIMSDDTDYDAVVDSLREQERLFGGRYTNAQFKFFPEQLILKYCSDKISQEQLIEFIQNDKEYSQPMLSKAKVASFEEEYNKIMG